MARRPTTSVDDNELLVGKLKKRYNESYTLFGERIEWDNAYIQSNLKDTLRPYQQETLAFFHDTQSNSKTDENFRHLLFNLATGAGKTMLMAAAILYLFKEKGYQNFLFFVHTDGILQKTIDNLINKGSSKYLFTQFLEINGSNIRIEKVDVFPNVPDTNTIYLKMVTIGKIHNDLNSQRENSISYDDLKDIAVVMLADEAHHYNALTLSTQAEKLKANAWERTIERIFNSNKKNRLLEFTATIDLSNTELFNKYRNKVVQRYDLRRFMEDGYSKKVMLLQVNQDDCTKMLDAVLLSQYRKLIAHKYGIVGFKPVVLFKSNTIAISLAKHEEFDKIIEQLTTEQITDHIQSKQKLLTGKPTSIWHKVAEFYKDADLQDVLTGIQQDFNRLNIINANSSDFIEESNAKILNSLEDLNNPFRVVFAVAKLSEGWDVLNLFDIVRISENSSTTSNSTNQEAQLIGRGARYFPFTYEGEKSNNRRFDNSKHDLAVLEQLHYHTINDTSYINNLNNSLTQTHILASVDGGERVLIANVKDGFKKTAIFQMGKLYLNRTIENNQEEKTLESYSAKDINLFYKITDESLLTELKNSNLTTPVGNSSTKMEVLQVDKRYFHKTIQRLKFYQFNNLKQYFPQLTSIDEFIQTQLVDIKVNVTIPNGLSLNDLAPKEKLYLLGIALTKIADSISKNYRKAIGTKRFYGKALSEIVKDYEIKIDDGTLSPTQKITEKSMIGKTWFVYDKAILNQLEHQMLADMETIITRLKSKYSDVYLVRNDERSANFKLTEFGGVRGFMPDFILILCDDNENLFYQVILEPKGEPYYSQDKWKEDMLEEMNNDIIIEETNNVKLVGVKFYRQFNDGHTDFTQEFFDDLSGKIFEGKPLFETKTTLLSRQESLFE